MDALSLGVFAHLDDAVRSLPAGTGTALVLDDADGADPVTWAWLAHVRRRRELPLLVVVALRDPAAAGIEPDTSLALEPPLDAAEVAELVGPDRAPELLERSGGNPLLLTELARADDADPDEIPGSLREAVTGRLRRTGPAEATLRAAAVLGATIDLDLLAAVLGAAPLDVLEQLDVGVRQAFLAEREGALAFRHELVRLAVAAGARRARRAWLHRRAAEVLRLATGRAAARAGPARPRGRRPGAGGRGAGARRRRRPGRLDLAGAERLLDEAIELHDTGPLRLRRSRVRMSRGDLDGADADAEPAMATDETGEALELRAWAARNRHDLDGAVRLGRAAAAAATDPTIRASSLIAVAFGHRGNGDLRAGRRGARRGRGRARRAGAAGVDRGPAGAPGPARRRRWPRSSRCSAPRRAAAAQGYWVEHTLQMTAHAYGLLGPERGRAARCSTGWSARSSGAGPGCGTPASSTPTAAGCCATSATRAAEELALHRARAGRRPGDPRPVPPRRRRLPAPRR